MSVNIFKNGTLTKIARGLKDVGVTITNNLLATKSGTALDAVQGKVLDDKITEVNSSLGGVSQFIVDETTGKITGYKTEIGGADTVFPFNTLTFIGNSDSQYVRTFSIASIDNNYSEYTASNFIINVTNVIRKDNVAEYQSTASLIKSYDSNTGILTINKVLHGNPWSKYGLYLEYEVYIRT